MAYGGELGNIYEGTGDKPNVLNYNENDANVSLIRKIFGDSPYVTAMENFAGAVEDPLDYFAGEQIDDILNKLSNLAEPQLYKFFKTPVGQYIANAIV
jgi:hypothetical protein